LGLNNIQINFIPEGLARCFDGTVDLEFLI
jgi:hypothetical protein